MKLTLNVWRQPASQSPGKLETYTVDGVSADMSFLEMFDLLNAEKVSRDMRRRKDSNHHAYCCPECRCWHVGSSDLHRNIKTGPQQPWRPLPISHYQQKAA